MTSQQSGKLGLRERKKARTRDAIQDAALRLYLKQGYHETTVEQIAEAAEVSPATFFRYFPTKAESVVYDRLDPVFLESFVQQPAELSLIAAFRAALYDVLDGLPPEARALEETRTRLVAEEPDLRAFWAQHLETDSRMVAEAVAKRVGRDPDDFEVAVFVGAFLGGIIAAFFAITDDPDMYQRVDRGLAYLEKSLRFDPAVHRAG